MKRAGISAIFIFVFLIMFGSYALKDFFVPKIWNYKVTVVVETPEGLKTGAGVWQVKAQRNIAGYLNPGGGIVTFKVIGEAAVVDLGGRGILMELPNYGVFLEAFPYRNNETVVQYYDSFLSVGKFSNLDISKHNFVTFTDLERPETIRTVHGNDLKKFFGSGVSLKSIVVQITDESVTWGSVRKYLKWFDHKRMGLSTWDPKYADQAQYLTKSSFIKGAP